VTARAIIEAGACGVEATMDDWHAVGRYLDFAGGPAIQRTACMHAEEAQRLADYVNLKAARTANPVRQLQAAE
jgi:hypothetical protein